uniref:Putative disease resistance protein RPM1-like n=1 Tax=Davidia involucrata TaxID=16924 RepID=A0A5B6Z2J5_DAVIN
MAEAAVGFLVQTIGSLLQDEAALLGAVRGEISDLKLELESTRSFLRDAHKYQNEGVRVWMAQVRDAAYKAEDIIDEFMYYIDHLKRRGGGFMGFLRRVVHLPEELLVKHRTAIKLQEIKAEIKAIAERSKRYDFGNVEDYPSSRRTPSWAQNLCESSFFIEGEDVVGIEKEKDMLVKWLVEGETILQQRTVISVWGMGGSGKTTLVSKAYNDHDVKRHFDCCAWISVSQNYVIEDVLRSMIEEFFHGEEELIPTGLSSMGYIQLGKLLVDFLQEKRYVVVLDDVWTNNFWRQVHVALPDCRLGSRIIITTRKEDIASYPYGVGSHVFHSKPLRKSDSWTLFCKKAFANDEQCPPELENLARALVEKCEGLPLAIVAMGGLMATKEKSELKWKAIYESLDWHLSNNPMLEVVKTILFLSFNDLPYYLKNCFLYCCLFPGDRWIAGTKLVQLWMAEGFLEERRGSLTPEEVGKIYLKELISRSLIQAVKKNQFFLVPKLCKLHDLMRELAISISERENFCSIYLQPGMKEEGRARHLSIFHTVDETHQFCRDMSQVRSFLAFNFDRSSTFSLNTLLSGFRLIRALDLKDAPIDNLPTSFGKLFNLRYLSLRGTRIKELPKSFGKLRNLQTLDLKRTQVKALPHGIVKLENLRHLITCRAAENEEFTHVIGMQVPADVWKLNNLQVLSCVEANSDVVKAIGRLTQIKKIYLTNVREEDEVALCASIEKLKLLGGLLVMVTDEEETLRMDALSSPPSSLRKLALIGRMKNVPPWFCKLQGIARLHLHWSRLTEDPIPHISVLPKLKHLTLVNAYDNGKVQLCFNEGFPELQQLSLLLLPELEEIIIAKGVMPRLIRLNLQICAKLKAVPRGIEHLTNLQELDLKEVSEELIKSIDGEESIDRPRVKHIPVINHYYKTASGHHEYESLS